MTACCKRPVPDLETSEKCLCRASELHARLRLMQPRPAIPVLVVIEKGARPGCRLGAMRVIEA